MESKDRGQRSAERVACRRRGVRQACVGGVVCCTNCKKVRTSGDDLIVGELACQVAEGIHEPRLQKALVVPAEALVNVELDLLVGCVVGVGWSSSTKEEPSDSGEVAPRW